jgi:hypothetical protein
MFWLLISIIHEIYLLEAQSEYDEQILGRIGVCHSRPECDHEFPQPAHQIHDLRREIPIRMLDGIAAGEEKRAM